MRCDMKTRKITLGVIALAATGCLLAGCESFDTSDEWWAAITERDRPVDPREETYRRRFQVDGDPEAMQWLLANRVQNGMSVNDINQVLGDEGEREFNDQFLKSNGGTYRASDVIYRWGPDKTGRSVYLGFRDGHLANFNPDEIAATEGQRPGDE
jgi:hypothetical protein